MAINVSGSASTPTSRAPVPSATAIDAPGSVAEARQPQYIAFLYRHPFVTDAYRLGFTPGVREDYTLQIDSYRNVDVPVLMLDNEFRDPDPERYIDAFRRYEPAVAVIGDANTADQARRYTSLARDLRAEFPETIVIIVPKCRAALDIIDDDIVLGYSLGYAAQHGTDIADPIDWRGRPVHLLGGSPPTQHQALQTLTQPTLTGKPPANIVGMDWNGPAKIAYKGEYWSRNGWQPADHLSIRETVRKSLREIRAFWRKKDLWPSMSPRAVYGDAVQEPDDLVWAATGSHIHEQPPDAMALPDDAPGFDPDDPDSDPLEDAIVVEYEDGRTLAYRTETEREHIEYREGLTPVADRDLM